MANSLDDVTREIPLVVKYETSRIWGDVRDALNVNKSGAAIAVALVEAHNLGKAVSYSRSRAYYDNRRCHPLLTYRRTISGVDGLDAGGYIDHFKQSPGARGKQSSMMANPSLVAEMRRILALHPELPLELPRSCISLRAADGSPLSLPDNRETHRMNRKVASINEGLVSVDVREPRGSRLGTPVTRIFNHDLSRGGRLYGHGVSWQNVTKDLRKRLTIDGQTLVELDYSTLHPALLYAEAGAPLPADCYRLKGWGRQLVKRAFLVLINARNVHASRLNIAHCDEMGMLGLDHQEALAKASRLIAEIKEAHRPIARAFHSDAGARLMRLDSDMAQHVLLSLHKKGIIALPVHDSFLVPVAHRLELETAMLEAAYRFGLRDIRIGEVVG